MGYYETITEMNLTCDKNISKKVIDMSEKGGFYQDWQVDEHRCKPGSFELSVIDYYFKWSDEFIRDLLQLQKLGVRGKVVMRGEEGEYYKYVIDDEGVKDFYGEVVFPETPDRIFKTEDDLLKEGLLLS